jgi:hypothetical protein
MRSSKGQFDPQLLEAFLGWADTSDTPAHRRATPEGIAAFTMGLTA